MPAAKSAKAAPAHPYEPLMKAMGLSRLDAFRRADLTPELRRKTGLAAEDEHRLTALAELCRLGLPYGIAEALALGGAVASASELASFTIEEMERVLRQDTVKRLLPADITIDRTMIEGWLRRAAPLTADEAASGRSAVSEASEMALARDEDAALAAEDISLSSQHVGELLTSLRQSWSRTEAAVEALTRTTAAPIDGATLRAALLDLQTGIGGAVERSAAPASAFVAADEASAVPAAEEDFDPSVEAVRLQGEIRRIEATIDTLRTLAASGSEASSPAAATEDGASERETSPRGE
jgi:hypothetical protein